MAPKSKTSKPQPADLCRLTVTIRGTCYTARPVRPEADGVTRAWRLRKADGTTYDVADTAHGATCDCADQTFRHEGIDAAGCKHVRALRALGLIDPEGDGPADWPAWTDAHDSTSTRCPPLPRGPGKAPSPSEARRWRPPGRSKGFRVLCPACFNPDDTVRLSLNDLQACECSDCGETFSPREAADQLAD